MIQYSTLVLTEQLYHHLREVDQTATTRLDAIMSDILVFNPPSDKSTDSIAWASHMIELRRVAEKMMLDEVVYA